VDKLIINAAITGLIPQKEDNPNVPIEVGEIIADAKRCYDAGASIVHVHARKADGTAAYEAEIYSQIIAGIREHCPEMLISASTSGRVFKAFEQRSQSLQPGRGLHPDFGSLTLGSMNFPASVSVNEPKMIEALAAHMNALHVVPEWECFELGMVEYASYLIKKSVLKKPYYCNVFLGSRGTISATAFNLTSMMRALPEGTTCSVAGIGRFQFPMNTMAITMGAHVRVGLEDNLYYDADKRQPATNAGLIERLVKVAKACGREICSPVEARQIIGMPDFAIHRPFST